ncbi:unnamed protein product [Blepharisma stoltei]|uniref:Uncharacterized protein n=1 Tax=Blepharisma stoltei TaxID=1481888 RepID=A0AAU9KDH1_9CILI|nr:unnamed protein product [Blepharisma stoltei]
MKLQKDHELFLTATKTQPLLQHPKLFDTEQQRKEEINKSIILATGVELGSEEIQEKSQFFYGKRPETAQKFRESKTLTDPRDRGYLSYEEEIQNKIQQEEMQLHKHKNLKLKLTVTSARKQYDNSPIKPGFYFFESLIKAPRVHINTLSQNIPESLYYTDKLYYLHTLPSGKVECTTDFFGFKFLQVVESLRGEIEETNIFNSAAAIMRGRADAEQDMQKIVLDWNQFQVKMIGNETIPSSLLQRFIKSPGGRPAVTRLYYFANVKSNKANYAYFVKRLDVEGNIQKCVVNMSKPETLEAFKMAGSALKPFEAEAEKIVAYLNKGYNIRIQEIILDYLRDKQGTIWLCGCKGFKIDESTLPNSLEPVKEWWPQTHLAESSDSEDEELQKKIEEKEKGLISFVHCKLCRLYYPNYELTHLVSVRMLMLYKVHVTHRLDLPWDTSHLKVATSDMLSQSVRICQFCYLLVTSEVELMKTEEKMAQALNVPKKELGHEEDSRLAVQLQFLPKQLVQWRILLLATNLYDFKGLINCSNLSLSFNFSGHITTFPIVLTVSENYGEPCIALGSTRMHFLFTAQEKSLKDFLNSNSLEVTIKEGKKPMAASRENSLTGLPISLPVGCALYQKKQVLLFDAKGSVKGNLSLIIGLSCDKNIPSKKIKVLLEKKQNAYIPEDHYMTTDPLPKEWMELFGAEALSDKTFGEHIEENEFYSPHLTNVELRRMEDVTSPYNVAKAPGSFGGSKNLKYSKTDLPLPRPESCKAILMKNKGFHIRKAKKQKSSIPRLQIDLNVPDEAKAVFHTVSDYLSSRPVSANVKRILESPLNSEFSTKRKNKTTKQRTKGQSSPSTRRSHASTHYDSSGSSLTSPAVTRRLQLERQMFMISQYANISAEDIQKYKGRIKKQNSNRELEIKKDDQSSSGESLNLDFKSETDVNNLDK